MTQLDAAEPRNTRRVPIPRRAPSLSTTMSIPCYPSDVITFFAMFGCTTPSKLHALNGEA